MSRFQSLLRYRKDPRFIVALSLVILITTTLVYYLIQQASELSADALSSRLVLFVLWNINLILILGILFVFIRVLVKLLLDRHRGILGSRFRTKLVVTYVLTSLVPIVLLFLIANDLLRVSIDRWFNVPVRQVLENSEQIAQMSQDRELARAERASVEIAEQISEDDGIDTVIQHVREFHQIDLAAIYQDGLVLRMVADPRAPVHELSDPPPRFFEELSRHGRAAKLDPVPGGKWLRHAVALDDGRAAVAGIFVSDPLSRLVDENIVAYQNFEQMEFQRPSLKASQTSLFLTVTLYILFGTLWTSIYISRRITGPVRALAEGTGTLAAGDYGHRIEMRAADEFGALIDSFNSMAEQLETQRQALTRSNEEMQEVNRRLDQERAYLSTVLGSVSTGIVAFGEGLDLLSINPAACRMLGIDEPPQGVSIDRLMGDDLEPLAACIRQIREGDFRPREITLIRGGDLRYFEVLGARLEGGEGALGWVVALEDTTQLVQAQKLAAWSEAAKRIAHEIKNPLTPIQLSAERIARKLREGGAELETVVEEGTQRIIGEVRHLKQMVDEFSHFARLPAVHPERASISKILRDVSRLFDDVNPGVTIRVVVDDDLEALIDPEQIRRAMINLVDNAIAATDEGEVLLEAQRNGRWLTLMVSDTGRGVSDEDKERLFLPYFSTKREGTGLGLAIVHRIIHDHDGRITIHDNEPTGTRFRIEIPA